MECNVKAYEGSDAYIFLDFCEEDSLRVYPVIERLALEGIPVWYRSNESNDVMLERLNHCSACVFVMSQQAIDNHAILSRLIVSLGNRRTTVVVRQEKLDMTVGVMMQLALVSCFNLSGESDYDAFLHCQEFQKVRTGKAAPTAEQISCWRDRSNSYLSLYRENRSNQTQTGQIAFDDILRKPDQTISSQSNQNQTIQGQGSGNSNEDNMTVQEPSAVIVRMLNGEAYPVTKALTRLGRNEQADIVITETHSISRFHAIIEKDADKYYLRSDNGRFGTYLEGKEITSEKKGELQNGSVFRLAKEDFFFAIGENAAALTHLHPEDRVREVRKLLSKEKESEENGNSKAEERYETDLTIIPDGPGTQYTNIEEYNEKTVWDDLIDEMTVRVTQPRTAKNDTDSDADVQQEFDDEKTVRQEPVPAGLIRLNTGEFFRLLHIENVIGRTTRHRQADVMIEGNSEISRQHATIFQYNNKFMLHDSGSMFGTFIGGTKIEAEQSIEITDMTVITLANESFLFICGKNLEKITRLGKLYIIKSKLSGESKYLLGEEMLLDRKHPWESGLLADKHISRQHAELFYENGSYHIRDFGSSNGTFVNRVRIPADGNSETLKNGDSVFVYDLEFSFIELELKEGGCQDD